MQSFNDVMTRNANRLLVNQPQLSVGMTSTFIAVLGPFIQADQDTNNLSDASLVNLSLLTASGQALANRAQDFNAFPFAGLPATVYVVFYVAVAPPPGASITIQANTLVGTWGNSLTNTVTNYLTRNAVTISNPSLASAPVAALCTQPGSAGNVVASTGSTSGVIVSNLPAQTGIMVSNATTVAGVSNPNGAGVGGLDPSTDTQLRTQAQSNTAQQNTNTQAALKVLAVVAGGATNNQAFDVYISDPAAGTRYIYYYWCCADGTMPGLTASTPTFSNAPDSTNYLASPTLTTGSLAAQIDLTIRSWVGAAVIPRIGCGVFGTSTASFQAVNLTAIPVAYSSPVLATVIEPQIQAAVVAYVQSLTHGQSLLPSNLYTAVQQAVGFALTGFNIGINYGTIQATTPASNAVTLTQILRCSGNPATVVTCTRIP